MKTLTHREACYELRRAARLLADGKVTLTEWCESVHRILAARRSSAPDQRPAPHGAQP
jgi:hypothetical protein